MALTSVAPQNKPLVILGKQNQDMMAETSGTTAASRSIVFMYAGLTVAQMLVLVTLNGSKASGNMSTLCIRTT